MTVYPEWYVLTNEDEKGYRIILRVGKEEIRLDFSSMKKVVAKVEELEKEGYEQDSLEFCDKQEEETSEQNGKPKVSWVI